jgi:hypothetical protein
VNGCASAIYRTLIHLYPYAFWRTFHDELEDDFADGSREAGDGGGLALSAFWIRTLADLATSLLREWLRTPWPPVLLAAAVLSVTMFGFTGLQMRRWPALLFKRVGGGGDPNTESLKTIVVLAIGALIPIAVAIVASAWAMHVRRKSMSRGSWSSVSMRHARRP